MEWLKNFVSSFFDILFKVIKWLLEFVIQFGKYVVYTVYDGILTVITAFLNAIEISNDAFNLAAQYSSMPTQLVWLINEISFPQAMGYIVLAIIIRMTLNIIPAAFTRI